MNDRKQLVINKAHQLFIEKGFQATSIQDIIDFSGISKGTFYNYFSSKNELLQAVFTSLNQRIDDQRNDLLIGQDHSNIEIFIKQVELQMDFNRRNKLIVLFEEVFVSNDPVLKNFLKRTQFQHLRWTYNRFVDIFGFEKQPYLLDCAIMFMGMLHQNIYFYFLAGGLDANINKVIRYTVDRLEKMVDDAEKNGVQLLNPSILEKWLPECKLTEPPFQKRLHDSVTALKKCVCNGKEQLKYIELLDFIQDEIIHTKPPRKFLVNSVLSSLGEVPGTGWKTELQKLEQIVNGFFSNKKYL